MNTLDGLRGVAALLVMLFHAREAASIMVTRGYLAVDLFFVLSGFVLARAYDARFKTGLGWRAFAVQRLIRVYPMYACGILIGLLLAGGSPTALLMLPDFGGGDALYPMNIAMWSLAFELAVNLAYAATARRIGGIGLGLVLAISGSTVLAGGLTLGHLDIGGFWSNAALGLVRTVFGFTLGVALFRLRLGTGTVRRQTPLAWLLFPLLFLLLAAQPVLGGLWDAACALILLPTIVWLGSIWELPQRRLLGTLGDMSYPLYCIHMPLLWAFGSGSPAATALLCAVLPCIAWLLDRTCDQPLRARLTALTRRPTIRPVAA